VTSPSSRRLPTATEVLEAELPRTPKMIGVSASSMELSRVVSSFAELEPQPDAKTYLSLPQGVGFASNFDEVCDRVLKLVIASSKRIFALWVNAFPYVNER